MKNDPLIWDTLDALGMDKVRCPHCGCEDETLLIHNWNFTHAHHIALNYQCHNRPQCDKYFKIGPLEYCICGWTRECGTIELKIEA
jgi:hypothetical protein